jgi:ankyrin repeat protein
MATNDNSAHEISISLETATNWARSNREWEKVYRYLFLHPKDFFVISPGRRWPIAHQVVFHGDVDLFKRILALFSDDQIDIRSKSGDGKTLLNVAIEKRGSHPAMFTYVNHLFIQDELIERAKQSDWRSVSEILEKNKGLENEKPPYSPYFLLHYVVQNGNAEVLKDLLDHFQFLTNVLNNKNETPLDMAIRLNKYDMCSILRPKTVVRPSLTQNQPPSPPEEHLYRSNERTTYHPPIKPPNDPTQYQPPTSMPNPTTKPIGPKTKSPYIGFEGVVVDISEDGDFTVGSSPLINSARNPPPPPPPQQQKSQSSSGSQHVPTKKKTIVSEYPLTNQDPPAPPPPPPPPTSSSSNEQLMRNLTCTLTQQIFVDPVIATDGQTYERAAILDWVNIYHCSPTTGAPMDATFRDNTEIKEIIQSIRKRS